MRNALPAAPCLLLLALGAPEPARAVTGLEDGYVYVSVSEPDGPPYSWLNAHSLADATDLGMTTGGSVTVTLPFTFPFFGTDWTEVTIHGSGVISMGSGENDPGTSASASCIADATATGAFIAPHWSYWDYGVSGDVFYIEYPDAVFVQWRNMRTSSSSTVDQHFGAWLHASGEISFLWPTVWSGYSPTSYGRTGTIGIQDGTGQGVEIGCWDLVLASGDGVTFTPEGYRHLAGVMPADDWANATLSGSGASDRFGWSVAVVGDATGDGLDDLAVGAPYNDLAASNAGAAWIFSGADLSGDLSTSDAVATIRGGAAADQAGYTVAGTGDVDGDGLDDLLVGAPYADGGGRDAGEAALFLGDGLTGTLSWAVADALLTGENAGDNAGVGLAIVEDMDGDGYAELLVGAPGSDRNGSDSGAAYLVYGGLSVSDTDLSAADSILEGVSAGDAAGYRVAGLGDVDSDGDGDLAVSSYGSDLGGSGAGAVYVVLARSLAAGASDLDDYEDILGEAAGYATGLGIAGAGDADGDGIGDLFVGAYNAGTTQHGAAYLVEGSRRSWPASTSSATASIMGGTSDRLGFAVADVDLDGDGSPSLAAGAYGNYDGAGAGGSVFIFDNAALLAGTPTSTTDAWGQLRGDTASGYLGYAVDAGDLDGDGYGDLVAGAYGVTGDASTSGVVYVVNGRPGYPDRDADGYMDANQGGPDCDDLDATVKPGATETCDGVDNDCDGVVDDGYGDADGDGVADCMETEVCDGLDNDGDGAVDEGMPDTDGDGTCDAIDTEECDGLDNDGDGRVDEGFADTDGDGTADCLDVEECDGLDNDGDGRVDEDYPDTDGDGRADCVDWESCDGLDNDGDGEVDEGFADTDGDGVANCVDSEECDGLDNDGDGFVDEGMTDTDGDGVCDRIDAEECDGLDNDGDGRVDEGFVDADGDGVADCIDGEDCDGIDNNGDGRVDEGYPDSDADGTADCIDEEECDGLDNDGDGLVDEGAADTDFDGVADCLDVEECDGLDNDGDGAVDEDYPDTDGDGAADCIDVETCDGQDNDGDGLVDEDFSDGDGDGMADCIDETDDSTDDDDDDGCNGCASGGAAPGAAWLLGLAGLALVRRRRA